MTGHIGPSLAEVIASIGAGDEYGRRVISSIRTALARLDDEDDLRPVLAGLMAADERVWELVGRADR